ncbi:MAG TPA: hypothetical protein PLS53_04565 [Thermoanaerobaculaceae bacterium]|nr:hypothetical protein [Thermoanaerobaculaceae bacterium]HPS77407.1 hypothetical protein [Thermoanaerobaculaceae bacterium]
MELMDLFRPKWRRSSPNVRLKAISELTDQAILAKMARSDWDREVRLAAAARVQDGSVAQSVYADLANCVYDGTCIRLLAATRLRDQALAQAVVLEMAGRQRLFFDHKEFLQWWDRVTDQDWLAEVAACAYYGSTQAAACKKLTDLAVLQKLLDRLQSGHAPDTYLLAVKTRLMELRIPEVARVTDTSELVRIARSDPVDDVRLAALARIADEEALLDIATSSDDPNVARTATARLTAQTRLANVAQHAVSSSARLAAVERLTEESCLAQVAEQDRHPAVSLAAVSRLRDQDLLAGVAERSLCVQARAAAVRGLHDEGRVLALAAKASSHFEERLAIAEKLVELGWLPRKVAEEVCPRCSGTGVVWVNTDSAFDRDVASYECGCGGGPRSVTVCCEKSSRPPFELTCRLADLEQARQERLRIPEWLR